MTVKIEYIDRIAAHDLIVEHKTEFTRAEMRSFDACMSMTRKAWAGWVDDVLMCVWALCPPTFLDNRAYLWMFHTSSLQGHEFLLVRHSQVVMEDMLKEYDSIYGLTIASNSKAIRWLKWLGASFGETKNGLCPFVIERRARG